MSETENKPKRSSLKNSHRLNPDEIMAYSKKRNSVSWKLGSNLKFDEVKAKFNIKEKKEENEHDKQFKEARRKSIKNEFSLAKELLKNDKEIRLKKILIKMNILKKKVIVKMRIKIYFIGFF